MDSTSTSCGELLIIGAGKVGLNVARRALAFGEPVRLWNPRPLDKIRSKMVSNLGVPFSSGPMEPLVQAAGHILAAVPDSEVAGLLKLVGSLGKEGWGALGVTSGSVELPAQVGRFDVVRFHPAFSFTTPLTPQRLLRKVCVVLSGPQRGVDYFEAFATKLGWAAVRTSSLQSVAYHAACVFAANLSAACLAAASEALGEAGIEPRNRGRILKSLLAVPASTAGNSTGPANFSGPASRGDQATLQAEMDLLAHSLPQLIALFRSGNAYIAHATGHKDLAQWLASQPDPKVVP